MDYKKDYYQILGIANNADQAEIKQAYRKLAVLYHPDKNPDNPEATIKFQEINEANEILSNESKRATYDKVRAGGYDDDLDFDLSGFRAAYNNSFRNQINLDIVLHINLTLADVYAGEVINYEYTKKIKCPTCNGAKIIDGKACPTCSGSGLIDKQAKFNIQSNSVVPGMVSRIVVEGGGHEYFTGATGNLIVIFAIRDMMGYEVDNKGNLYKFIDVHPDDCINGAEYNHIHIDGKKYKTTIPKESNAGSTMKMKGLGLKNKYIAIRSDLYLRINLVIDYSRYVEIKEENINNRIAKDFESTKKNIKKKFNGKL